MAIEMTRLAEEIQRRLNAEMETIKSPPKPQKETKPAKKLEIGEWNQDAEGKVEYADIVGEPHPSGQEYYFTVYKREDWEEELQALIPEIDNTFVFNHEYALSLLMGIEYNKAVFAYGPPGSGKTETPAQICARLNYPFMFISGMGGTEPSDYIGTPWVKDGNMEWKDGPATAAVRKGVFLLYDEPFKASAQTNMCFQSLLDDRRILKLYGHPDVIGGNLKAHPNFRFALADNVRGFGDGMGKYAAEVQDTAFLNRVAYKVHVPYPNRQEEEKIMEKRYPTATKEFIRACVSLATIIRTGWDKDEFTAAYSLRDTGEFIDAALKHQDAGVAFKQTYYNVVKDEDERKALEEGWKLAFPSNKL